VEPDSGMHYIEQDLEEGWIDQFLVDLCEYLVKWAVFEALYGVK
jgi:hypothetical protein